MWRITKKENASCFCSSVSAGVREVGGALLKQLASERVKSIEQQGYGFTHIGVIAVECVI